MKDLERRFFRFCCKNIKHNFNGSKYEILIFRNEYNFENLIDEFLKKYPEESTKQLLYYINKWKIRGLVENIPNYGSVFRFNPTHNNNIDQYIRIIPSRIISHNVSIRYQIKKYSEFTISKRIRDVVERGYKYDGSI